MNLHCLSYLTHHLLLQLSICFPFHLHLMRSLTRKLYFHPKQYMFFLAWFLFIAFFIWAINFYMPLFTTTKASIIVRIEITRVLVAIPFFVGFFVTISLQESTKLFRKQAKVFFFTFITWILFAFVLGSFQKSGASTTWAFWKCTSKIC